MHDFLTYFANPLIILFDISVAADYASKGEISIASLVLSSAVLPATDLFYHLKY